MSAVYHLNGMLATLMPRLPVLLLILVFKIARSALEIILELEVVVHCSASYNFIILADEQLRGSLLPNDSQTQTNSKLQA
mgnify:CR=1 FL=1